MIFSAKIAVVPTLQLELEMVFTPEPIAVHGPNDTETIDLGGMHYSYRLSDIPRIS